MARCRPYARILTGTPERKTIFKQIDRAHDVIVVVTPTVGKGYPAFRILRPFRTAVI